MITDEPEPADPERSLTAARVVLILGAGTAVSLLGDSTLYTVLPRAEIAAEAGVTLAMVGVLLGANRAFRLLSNGVAGVLYDRLPRRPLLAASLFTGALSTLLFAVGRGPLLLLLSRFMWGAAWSGIWVGGNAAVLDVASAHNRGRLSGRYQMWFFLGSGLTALIGGVLTDLVGFRQGLAIGGLLTLAAAGVWLVTLPAFAHRRGAEGLTTAPREKIDWGEAIYAAIPMFVSRFVFAGVVSATGILWLSRLVGEQVTLAALVVPIATLTGLFAAVRSLVSVGGAGLAGRVSDLTKQRWLVIAGALAAGALGVWLATSATIATAVVGGLLAAVTAGGVQAVTPAIVGDRNKPEQQGRVLGAVYTLGDLGSAIAPPLAFWALGVAEIGTIYLACAVLLGITAVFAMLRHASA